MSRTPRLIITLLALLGAIATAAPAASALEYMPDAGSNPFYKGWGRVAAIGFEPCSPSPGAGCVMGGPSSYVAYKWSGSAWSKTSRPMATRVYVYPYGGDWRWTWTSDRGWLAMRAGDLRIQMEYIPVGNYTAG